MKNPVKLVIRTTAILVVALVLIFVILLLVLQLTEFRPETISVRKTARAAAPLDTARTFTLFSWNIGYAGLGKEMDFFYDGGSGVRPGHTASNRYFEGIKQIVRAYDTADLVLLQEVDIHSKRSWYNDQFQAISEVLRDHKGELAINYDCRFVPVPLLNPLGRVMAGIATFSKPGPAGITVRYYQAGFSWPMNLVMLDYCYIMMRFPTQDGRELVVANLHNSAYDSTGMIRLRELSILDSALTAEYAKGNRVIAGGDWNNNPRGYDPRNISTGDRAAEMIHNFPDQFFNGWRFVYDSARPSERYTNMPYVKGKTETTIIDFFIVSPNVKVQRVKTINLGFEWSDHNPVVMTVKLN